MKQLIHFFKEKFNENHFILFWFLLNFFQIATTELTSDEGYYWFYSKQLDWGYYDHPPMLAFLIKFGKIFFQNEIAVRLGNVILMCVALFFLFKIRPWTKKEKRFIYLIVLAFPLLNYITFIAFPDSPLVAFSMIALYLYKQFLEKNSFKTALLLAVAIVFLLYSKYHALLFIFFVLLSNLKLFTNKYLYLISAIVILFLIPHILWQVDNDWASFKYHLYGRSKVFKFRYVTEYITQQIPIIGLGLIWVPFVVKPQNQFQKSLKYIAIGSMLFFLFSSLRGFVHIHWNSMTIFPIIILATLFYSQRKNNKLFNGLVIPFIFLLVIIRLYLSLHIFPLNGVNSDYYHERKLWAEDLKNIAQNRTLIFEGGNEPLREAPLYEFYGNGKSIAFFPSDYKKSQYQIWQYEDSIQQQNIVLVKGGKFNGGTELKTRMGKTIFYVPIDNFTSFNNIKIDFYTEDITLKNNILKATISIKNHRQKPIKFSADRIFARISNTDEKVELINLKTEKITIKPNQEKTLIFSGKIGKLNANTNEILFGFTDDFSTWSENSKRKKITLE